MSPAEDSRGSRMQAATFELLGGAPFLVKRAVNRMHKGTPQRDICAVPRNGGWEVIQALCISALSYRASKRDAANLSLLFSRG